MSVLPTKTSLISIDLILDKAGIELGQKAADLGCGRSLFFLYALSSLVGKDGEIFGVDILPEAIDSISRDIKHHHLQSIKILKGDLEKTNGIPLPSHLVDAAFLINTLHQATDSLAMLREARRLLKTKGKLIVVDWETIASPLGPDRIHRIAKDDLMERLELCDLKALDHFVAGPYHYGIVITKR